MSAPAVIWPAPELVTLDVAADTSQPVREVQHRFTSPGQLLSIEVVDGELSAVYLSLALLSAAKVWGRAPAVVAGAVLQVFLTGANQPAKVRVRFGGLPALPEADRATLLALGEKLSPAALKQLGELLAPAGSKP